VRERAHSREYAWNNEINLHTQHNIRCFRFLLQELDTIEIAIDKPDRRPSCCCFCSFIAVAYKKAILPTGKVTTSGGNLASFGGLPVWIRVNDFGQGVATDITGDTCGEYLDYGHACLGLMYDHGGGAWT